VQSFKATTSNTLTVFSNWFGRVIKSSAVLGIDVDLLRIVVARLELRDKLHAVNQMPRPLCDASDTCREQLLRLTLLHEGVSAADGTRHWSWWIHCQPQQLQMSQAQCHCNCQLTTWQEQSLAAFRQQLKTVLFRTSQLYFYYSKSYVYVVT